VEVLLSHESAVDGDIALQVSLAESLSLDDELAVDAARVWVGGGAVDELEATGARRTARTLVQHD